MRAPNSPPKCRILSASYCTPHLERISHIGLSSPCDPTTTRASSSQNQHFTSILSIRVHILRTQNRTGRADAKYRIKNLNLKLHQQRSCAQSSNDLPNTLTGLKDSQKLRNQFAFHVSQTVPKMSLRSHRKNTAHGAYCSETIF